jgi:iron complex outermembrane receptor protein
MGANWARTPSTGSTPRGSSGKAATAARTTGEPCGRAFDTNTQVSGGHLLARWVRAQSDGGELRVQAYYDHTDRDAFFLHDVRDTVDLDLQHRLSRHGRHELLWGAGVRYIADDTSRDSIWYLDPASRQDWLFSAFVQDEVFLMDDRLRVTVGSKLEHNDFTGLEVQPNLRALYLPDPTHSIWAAVSRAVRTPSRTEHDGFIELIAVPGTDLIATAVGSDDMDSEVLMAYEAGYRYLPDDRLQVDLALFYNDYDHLRTLEPADFTQPGPPWLPPHQQIPVVLDNRMQGQTYGLELAASWQASDDLRLHLAYTYIDMHLRPDPDSGDTGEEDDEGDTPEHQIALRAQWDPRPDWELDTTVRFVDETMRPVSGRPTQGGERYWNLDLRLGWQPSSELSLSLVARNLLDDHREFRAATIETEATKVEPSVFLQAAWQLD